MTTQTTNDNDGTYIEVNLPFDRLPQCSCDKGFGEPLSASDLKIKMAGCKLRQGPCSKKYWDNPENCKVQETTP